MNERDSIACYAHFHNACFWVSLVWNSVVLAVYLLFSVVCFFTVHEHHQEVKTSAVLTKRITHFNMTDIERYRELYPKGSKLELLSDLSDPYTLKFAGDIFTVDMIDDAGNIHGSWASGGSLSLIIGVDQFRLVR
ncbi:MAG: DUF4314 domain-containing protein [Lachnospiraceae bacterium]|nr:DUF4314 domain-containing protein [Lachnospiraceae bacterium]